MTSAMTLTKSDLKMKTLATAGAITAAVALPQVFHVVGAVSGLGAALGQTLLPMHLPVLLAGLLAGPIVGMVAGALSPLVSFALSGMPMLSLLPFMVLELAAYGLAAGLLARTRMPVLFKVLIAQIAGRAVHALAILIVVHGLGVQTAPVVSVWTSVLVGLPGLLLQWSLIPFMVFWVESKERNRE